VVPHVAHTEGSDSDTNALTEERCDVDAVMESLSLPIDLCEEESRIECLLDSSFSSLDIHDEFELEETRDGDVTCPVVDVDMLIQDFACELQHVIEEFGVVSGSDIGVSVGCPCGVEDEPAVSGEPVLEQVVQQDSTGTEFVSDVTVVESVQLLSPTVSVRSVSVGVRHVGSDSREARGPPTRSVSLDRTSVALAMSPLALPTRSVVLGDETLLRGVVAMEPRRVFDPGGRTWTA